jgi:ArsR family transcriptional regulator
MFHLFAKNSPEPRMIPSVLLPLDLAQCAPRGLSVALDRGPAVELTGVLKALADPTRLQIISLVNSAPDGKACVCDLADSIAVSQPTISHHLRILREAGLLEREKRGTWVWYSLNRARLSQVTTLLA